MLVNIFIQLFDRQLSLNEKMHCCFVQFFFFFFSQKTEGAKDEEETSNKFNMQDGLCYFFVKKNW